jgi:hypothetical protein
MGMVANKTMAVGSEDAWHGISTIPTALFMPMPCLFMRAPAWALPGRPRVSSRASGGGTLKQPTAYNWSCLA